MTTLFFMVCVFIFVSFVLANIGLAYMSSTHSTFMRLEAWFLKMICWLES